MRISSIYCLMVLLLAPIIVSCASRPGGAPLPAGSIPFVQEGQPAGVAGARPVAAKKPVSVPRSKKMVTKKRVKRSTAARKSVAQVPAKAAAQPKAAPAAPAAASPPIPLPVTKEIPPLTSSPNDDKLGIYQDLPRMEPPKLQ